MSSEIRLRFGELLRRRGLTPNRLARSARNLSRNTVYALANPSSDRVRVDLIVLAAATDAVASVTSEPVTLEDVLEVVSVAPTSDRDEEDRIWLETDASRLGEYEPYDWGDLDPFTAGEPVHVTGDGRVVVGDPEPGCSRP